MQLCLPNTPWALLWSVRLRESPSGKYSWLKWCASHGNMLIFFWSSLSHLFLKWRFHVSVEHQSDLIIVFSYVTDYRQKAVSKILIRLHLVSLGNRVYDSCSIDDDYTWYADGWFVSSSVCVLYRSQIHTKINELRWLLYSNRAAEGETFHQLLVHWTCIFVAHTTHTWFKSLLSCSMFESTSSWGSAVPDKVQMQKWMWTKM